MAVKRRPPGPPLVLRPVAQRPDGADVMVWERVAETLRLGAFIEDAAARCGISGSILTGWVRHGARLRSDLLAGARLPQTLTEEEHGLARVAEAVEQAEAEGKVFLLGLLERVSRGAEVRTVTTKHDAQGNVTERTERTEYLAPDSATLRWRLERRWPEQYGRTRLEVTGLGGAPIEVTTADRAAELAADLRARHARPPRVQAKRLARPRHGNGQANGAPVNGVGRTAPS